MHLRKSNAVIGGIEIFKWRKVLIRGGSRGRVLGLGVVSSTTTRWSGGLREGGVHFEL